LGSYKSSFKKLNFSKLSIIFFSDTLLDAVYDTCHSYSIDGVTWYYLKDDVSLKSGDLVIRVLVSGKEGIITRSENEDKKERKKK